MRCLVTVASWPKLPPASPSDHTVAFTSSSQITDILGAGTCLILGLAAVDYGHPPCDLAAAEAPPVVYEYRPRPRPQVSFFLLQQLPQPPPPSMQFNLLPPLAHHGIFLSMSVTQISAKHSRCLTLESSPIVITTRTHNNTPTHRTSTPTTHPRSQPIPPRHIGVHQSSRITKFSSRAPSLIFDHVDNNTNHRRSEISTPGMRRIGASADSTK
ncbi:hypothetical protein EK21DRAFT_115244 [Setomelanomma holmii]|uniref:Uncharacterized protein n=1 Tax=Setomelanomma holmii TaxID=210430 RepID=A0A9P4LJV4_9PLEO|nr:hypothetical protein EK21DRAFT_115244 [Setomelanomma holmii]